MTDSTKKKTLKKIPSKKKKPKKKEKKPEFKPYWWEEELKIDNQTYNEEFFTPFINQIEPKLGLNEPYSDPIYDEELKIMSTSDDTFKDASATNLNLGALYKHYEQNILPPQMKKKDGWLIGILIPSGTGNMSLHCGVSLSSMFKPRHRIHTVQGHNIGILRNMLVRMALQNRDCTHVFFLDSDVVMPPFGLIRMLRRDEDIVSGIYTMKAPPYVPLAIMRPKNAKGEKKYNYYIDLTQNLLNKYFPIDASGAGCLLIKREVLEKMGPPWFQVTPQEHGLSAIGEDLFFFDKAIEMGFKSYLDTSIQCEHVTGGTSYPQVFFAGQAAVGPRARHTVNRWNKNAILWTQGLPFFKEPEQPKEVPAAMAPPTQHQIPISIEQRETVGDARSVEK